MNPSFDKSQTRRKTKATAMKKMMMTKTNDDGHSEWASPRRYLALNLPLSRASGATARK